MCQVEEMVRRTAAGLPQVSKPADKKAASAPAWNIHSASTKVHGTPLSLCSVIKALSLALLSSSCQTIDPFRRVLTRLGLMAMVCCAMPRSHVPRSVVRLLFLAML